MRNPWIDNIYGLPLVAAVEIQPLMRPRVERKVDLVLNYPGCCEDGNSIVKFKEFKEMF
jgi:hypothetical protein